MRGFMDVESVRFDFEGLMQSWVSEESDLLERDELISV